MSAQGTTNSTMLATAMLLPMVAVAARGNNKQKILQRMTKNFQSLVKNVSTPQPVRNTVGGITRPTTTIRPTQLHTQQNATYTTTTRNNITTQNIPKQQTTSYKKSPYIQNRALARRNYTTTTSNNTSHHTPTLTQQHKKLNKTFTSNNNLPSHNNNTNHFSSSSLHHNSVRTKYTQRFAQQHKTTQRSTTTGAATATTTSGAIFLTATDEHGNQLFVNQRVDVTSPPHSKQQLNNNNTISSTALGQDFVLNASSSSDSETDTNSGKNLSDSSDTEDEEQTIVLHYNPQDPEQQLRVAAVNKRSKHVSLDTMMSFSTSTDFSSGNESTNNNNHNNNSFGNNNNNNNHNNNSKYITSSSDFELKQQQYMQQQYQQQQSSRGNVAPSHNTKNTQYNYNNGTTSGSDVEAGVFVPGANLHHNLHSSQYKTNNTTTSGSDSDSDSMRKSHHIRNPNNTNKDPTQAELPAIIGAPPDEFNHPYDIKYSKFQKFLFSLRRGCVIFWTFLPFIRHYVWTHVLHTPGPKDRQDMLEKLLVCLEASGCAFIKFGQWLSMRPDIFPLDVIEVLSRLRDGAPAHEFHETREIIKEEFGRDINELFLSFSPEPVASGSIAQVYKATLLPHIAQEFNIRNAMGELISDVAVKIRHPGVLRETWIDLDIIYAIVDRVPRLCIPFNKEELKLMIQYQIDFRFEGHYLSRFRRNFASEIHQGYIAFPYVSEESLRQSVLVESWAGGSTVGDIFVEVGDMFRPIVKQMSKVTPVQTHPYEGNSVIEQVTRFFQIVKETGRLAKSWGIDALYNMADKYDIKVDHHNSLTNTTNLQLDTTPLALFLRRLLPPRGRVGEEPYTWNPTLSDEENLREKQKKTLAYTLFDMFIKMFLRDNLIHADLHAGNVLYDNHGYNHTATVLDAGMTVELEPDIMKQFGLFLRAICDGDADGLVEAVSRFEVNLPDSHKLTPLKPLKNDSSHHWEKMPPPIGSGMGHLATNQVIRSDFRRDIHSIFHRFYSNSAVWNSQQKDAENVSIGDVVGQVLLSMQKHGVVLRGDVAASIMAMSIIEGLLRQLDPELDIVVKAIPYFLKYKQLDQVLLRTKEQQGQ